MLAEEIGFVVGVDTHADHHAVVVVDAVTQRARRALTIAATRRGYRQALRLADRLAPGDRVWALEGSGSYGSGLARFLSERGERVLEVERPAREGPRSRFKSDPLDAEQAARQVLAGEAGALPRLSGDTQALRVLLSTREGAVNACTAALNELRALIITSPPELRERLQGLTETRLLNACVRLRPGADSERAALALALRSLAQRVRLLRTESQTLERELERRVQALAPQLLARPGIGPISAAAVLIAWSQPRRIRSSPNPSQLRQDDPLPARPRRRPPTKPRAPHDHPQPTPHRQRNQGLHRPPPRRGKNPTRSHPLPQTLPRPQPLPNTRDDAHHLTLIEASALSPERTKRLTMRGPKPGENAPAFLRTKKKRLRRWSRFCLSRGSLCTWPPPHRGQLGCAVWFGSCVRAPS